MGGVGGPLSALSDLHTKFTPWPHTAAAFVTSTTSPEDEIRLSFERILSLQYFQFLLFLVLIFQKWVLSSADMVVTSLQKADVIAAQRGK